MHVTTVHTSLTPICNVWQLFVWTGLLDHRAWIRLNMHRTFFRVWFQLDICNPGLYRSSRMHWLLNGGWFHKTVYRLWFRASAWDDVCNWWPWTSYAFLDTFFYNEIKTMWKFSLLDSHVLRQNLGVPRRSLLPRVDALAFDVRITRVFEWYIFYCYVSFLDSIKSLVKNICCVKNVIPIKLWVV